MNTSFSIVFKGQVCTNVLLFEVRVISDDLSKSIVVGSVVVNADSYRNTKTYIQGHNCMNNFSKEIVEECVTASKNIIETMQMDI